MNETPLWRGVWCQMIVMMILQVVFLVQVSQSWEEPSRWSVLLCSVFRCTHDSFKLQMTLHLKAGSWEAWRSLRFSSEMYLVTSTDKQTLWNSFSLSSASSSFMNRLSSEAQYFELLKLLLHSRVWQLDQFVYSFCYGVFSIFRSFENSFIPVSIMSNLSFSVLCYYCIRGI